MADTRCGGGWVVVLSFLRYIWPHQSCWTVFLAGRFNGGAGDGSLPSGGGAGRLGSSHLPRPAVGRDTRLGCLPAWWSRTPKSDYFIISQVLQNTIFPKAFFRLFEYIDGDNEAGQKIDMTAPVTFRVVAGEGPNCESNYTMAFYIPGQLQSGPPAPRNSEVWLEQRQDIRFAVRRLVRQVLGARFYDLPQILRVSHRVGLEPRGGRVVPLDWGGGPPRSAQPALDRGVRRSVSYS